MSSVCVLMVATGAPWESEAFAALTRAAGVVVLRRCVDVDDLLAAATAGQADVAVLALEAHGLDATAVEHLRRHRVLPVAVCPAPDSEPATSRAVRIGVATLVAEDAVTTLPDVVVGLHVEDTRPPGPAASVPGEQEPAAGAALEGELYDDLPVPGPGGRTIAVWGPAGAPGRTTVALGLAAELARRDEATVLVDADPYGGSVAQHLGILDEVSGMLSAARLSASGELAPRFPAVARAVAPQLAVVTGLPRADRWIEVRHGVVEHLAEVAGAAAHVVMDTGFCLEADHLAEIGAGPGRNSLTLDALQAADEIVVVGAADPVGLSRLARGLVDLREVTQGVPVRVVVNRMRPSLGWSESDIAGMVEGFARVLGLHFLPEDRTAVDRALIAGRTLAESGESSLQRGLQSLAAAVVPVPAGASRRRQLRTRTAGRARRG